MTFGDAGDDFRRFGRSSPVYRAMISGICCDALPHNGRSSPSISTRCAIGRSYRDAPNTRHFAKVLARRALLPRRRRNRRPWHRHRRWPHHGARWGWTVRPTRRTMLLSIFSESESPCRYLSSELTGKPATTSVSPPSTFSCRFIALNG